MPDYNIVSPDGDNKKTKKLECVFFSDALKEVHKEIDRLLTNSDVSFTVLRKPPEKTGGPSVIEIKQVKFCSTKSKDKLDPFS